MKAEIILNILYNTTKKELFKAVWVVHVHTALKYCPAEQPAEILKCKLS